MSGSFFSEGFDRYAIQVLQDHYGVENIPVHPVDIDQLALERGYRVDYADLLNTNCCIGLCTYCATVIPNLSVVDGNTILLDQSLLKEDSEHRRRFTLAHEVSHLLIFETCKDPEIYQRSVAESIEETVRDITMHREQNENHANALALSLLIPITALQQILPSKFKIHTNGPYIGREDKKQIESFAKLFDVSSWAMRSRLFTLGYLS